MFISLRVFSIVNSCLIFSDELSWDINESNFDSNSELVYSLLLSHVSIEDKHIVL